MIGGTTATVVVVDRNTLAAGWVGDSMAVLGRLDRDGENLGTISPCEDAGDAGNAGDAGGEVKGVEGGEEVKVKGGEGGEGGEAGGEAGWGVRAQVLTTDHDVGNDSELDRVNKSSSGGVCGRYVSVNGAEGMLQVTRSLGDVPHHSGGVVSHDPETSTVVIGPEHPFLIIASDGLWNAFTADDAVQRIFTYLIDHGYEEGRRKKE